ncbi:MAG: hypothetical protein V4699_03810 [Patescibacteria group bacterium]
MKNNFIKFKRQSGSAMLISVVFFLFIILAIIGGLVSPTVREFQNANVNLNSKKSYFLAESGGEDAFYRIRNNMAIDSSETITLDSNSTTTTISNLFDGSKQITSLGDVLSLQRETTLILRTGAGTVFKYGTQAGQGGFVFQNNSYVTGSIYSNGDVLGSNGAYITGDAYAAGSTGLIDDICVGGVQTGSTCAGTPTGNAHAHTVTDSDVTGTVYCQTGSGNNKACNTSEEDPVAQDLPITDSEIAQWQADATNGGTTTGNVTISTPTTLGPVKIIGNLTVDDTLTIADTIYVTGNVIINSISGGQSPPPSVKLNSSYGSTSGIIIADGYIILNNGVIFGNSGTAGSYILLLSTSTCDASVADSPCNGINAIEVSNNSSISIVNAQQGTVYFSNNASVKEAVGKKIELKNGVGISYGTGLINVNFTSGPSGSWSISSWGETE